MRKTILTIIAVTLAGGALLLAGCNRSGSTPADPAALRTTEFAVESMTCSGCEAGIKMAVGRLDGVEKVTASHTQGAAEVSYDPAKTSPDEIVATIDKLGYQASLEHPVPGTKEN